MYLRNMTKTDVQTNKDIWKLVISFRIKKGFFENTEIMLAEKGKIVSEKKKKKKFFQRPLHRYCRTLLLN